MNNGDMMETAIEMSRLDEVLVEVKSNENRCESNSSTFRRDVPGLYRILIPLVSLWDLVVLFISCKIDWVW